MGLVFKVCTLRSKSCPATNKKRDLVGLFFLFLASVIARALLFLPEAIPNILRRLLRRGKHPPRNDEISLPLTIWRSIDSRLFSNTLIHGHIGIRFTENAIVNGP